MAARSPHWAATLVVPADFLNALAAHGIGEGVVAPDLHETFQLPMMGPMELTVGMTIVGVSFEMRAGDGGRLRATVHATGRVEVHGDTPLALPGLVRVSGEVLVEPVVELRDDHSFVAYLDLPGSELVATHFDGIDGVDHDAEAQAQLSQMLFATVGGDLFGAMAQNLGTLGLELPPERGVVVSEAGIAPGRAQVRVRPGRMEVGFPAVEGLDGGAVVVPVEGARVGLGVASGAVAALATALAGEQLGTEHLPFELDVTTGDASVGGRVRSTRLVHSELLPDLRAGISYQVEPRLAGDVIELTLRAAWLELPVVPPVVNRVNRWLGGIAARAVEPLVGPLTVRIPARGEVPARPDSEVTMTMAVAELRVDGDGVEAVVAADLLAHTGRR